ncbi:MAG: DNA recombination protein RmuC, partial [Cyclobacteriaceae bacterium]
MEVVIALAGAAVGVVLGWFIARARSLAETQNQTAAYLAEQERNRNLATQLQELKADLEKARNQVLELTNSLASTEADYRNLEERLAERKNELTELQEKFAAQFKNLANDIFEDKSKRFTDQNKSNISELLKPLGEKITDFEKKVDSTHKDAIKENAALREQLQHIQKLNVEMTREAENLTRALKGDSQAQGAWGEFILESILEKSGLERDREYTVQESFTTAEGRLRPDVIIRLPEKKHVIIDSKVSLTAYNNFVNAETDAEKTVALKAHLASIRQHMKGLADKNYQANISDNGLDFIIMFIPIEPAYIVAIQSEKSLYEEALEKRIVFVSPTLLIPSLQLIKHTWRQENQNRNAIEIANKAGDLYDKFVSLSDDLKKIGHQMDSTKSWYEESM